MYGYSLLTKNIVGPFTHKEHIQHVRREYVSDLKKDGIAVYSIMLKLLDDNHEIFETDPEAYDRVALVSADNVSEYDDYKTCYTSSLKVIKFLKPHEIGARIHDEMDIIENHMPPKNIDMAAYTPVEEIGK